MLNRSLSLVLVLSLIMALWLPVGALAMEGGSETPFRVLETDSWIYVNAQTYDIEIEKEGFKYSFKKPDGTLIADGHQQSGIRYSAPGGPTLFDAVSTELNHFDEEKVIMTVTSETGQRADVTIYPLPTYAKFEISPRDEEGDLPEPPEEPERTLRMKQTDLDDAAAVTGSVYWAYDTIESRIMIETSTGSSASGLVFGFQSDTNYYYARLHDNKQQLQLLRTKSDNSGALEVIKNVPLSIERNVWYDMKIELDEGRVKISVDDQELIDWSEAAAEFVGKIGVKSFKTTVHYDDLRVSLDNTEIYADDFQSSDTSGWTIQRGELVIHDPEMDKDPDADEPMVQSENVMVFDSLPTENGIARAGEADWQYDLIEADMLIEKSSGSSASGLVFGYQNPDQYYYVRLHDAKGEVQLLKTDSAGTLKVVAKTGEMINRNVWYNLKAKIEGNTISVFVDGVERIVWTDTDAAFDGEIGVKAYKTAVQYGGIRVKKENDQVYFSNFASGDINEWTLDEGNLFVQKRVENRSFIIDARTAPITPAYGLGDDGRFGDGSNVFGFSETDRSYVENNGTTSRFISNFIVFPKQGFAQVLFDDYGKKRVTLNATENKMGVSNAERIDRLYYFVGDMKQIYADYQQVRFAEGYPEFQPKSNFFEVGYEAFGSLGWNTAQETVKDDVQKYLDQGYRLKWAVVGSGFWKGDRNDPEQAITTSFGMWDDTYQDGRTDKYPNPRYPDVEGFKDFFDQNGIKFLIGIRTNFKALPKDGGYYNPDNDGTYTQDGVDNGYFVKSVALDGAPQKFTVNAFPNGPVYMLNPEAPGAVEWYKEGADLWGVDGFKEDTMVRMTSSDSLWNKANEALMQAGYEVMVRNSAYSVPGDIIRVEDTRWDYDQDFPVLVALSMAASGAPNVYSDIVAGKSLPKNMTEAQKLYFVRDAAFSALTPAMSMGLGPWHIGNEDYESNIKKSVDFHSAYAPYIYSAAVDSFETGFPYTMTPLPIAYPDDANTYDLANKTTRQYEWMLGESILATPLFGNDLATATSRDVYLPDGKWIDYETGDVYEGQTTLKNFELPLDKIPVFVGGKGVLVKRDLDTEKLHAEVYPIQADGSEYRYTYPDGESKSMITNNNKGWDKDYLVITDTTVGEEVSYDYNETTGSFSFLLTEGHDYELSGGEQKKDIEEPEDTDKPIWASSSLSASNVGERSLTLTWSGASDNTGVVGYRIDRNGTQGVSLALSDLTVTDDMHSYLITGLSPDTSYTFKVEAVDAADNWSTNGPSLTVSTKATSTTPNPPVDPDPIKPVDPVEDPDDSEDGEGLVADIEPLDEQTSQAMLANGTGDGAHVQLVGSAYEVTAHVAEGEEAPDDGRLLEPITFELSYDASIVDEALLGVYVYNEEKGLWEYVGGKLDQATQHIQVEVTKAGRYAVLAYDKTFADVADDHWVHDALKHLSAKHIVNGISEDEFAPSGLTTRAEFAALLVRTLGIKSTEVHIPFTDIPDAAWYAEEVGDAYAAGIINGVGDTTFAPDDQISREQMAVMIVRAYEYMQGLQAKADGQLAHFKDGERVSAWAEQDVNKTIELGLMQGKGSGRFAPDEDASRAESAMVIYNLLQLLK